MAFPSKKYGKFLFQGSSIAGTCTTIACKELNLSFDVGNGPFFLVGRKHFFITHGHADHIGGLPYLLSMKAMSRHEEAQVYVPESLASPLEEILAKWQEIEGHEYNYKIQPVNHDSEFSLKGPYFVRPFPTFHRVSSNGYTVFERKKKLKPELQGKDQKDIIEAKSAGEEIHSLEETPLISFTGDTKIEFFDQCPWIKKSKTLFVEVSFIDDKRTIEETRHWGHIHLEELLPRISEFAGEHLVLIHLSARYHPSHLETLLDEKLPSELRSKVSVFPRN